MLVDLMYSYCAAVLPSHINNSQMKKFIFASLLVLLSISLNAQEKEIRATIDKMFKAMSEGDTASLRACFIPSPQLMTFAYDAKGNPRVKAETINNFINGVSTLEGEIIEERLMGWHILIDDGLASVWTPYEFYFDNKFHHCGVNNFQLVKIQGVWKISNITDSRRASDCIDENKTIILIDSLINEWHRAAAKADEDLFFGRMAADGIYIGTDPSERWLRDELAEWPKKYFDRDSAWDFKPISRNIKLDPGGRIAWFDELLDTWMGVCRSTGILEWRDNDWKIVYYHLSVSVPNDKIDAYLSLFKKG